MLRRLFVLGWFFSGAHPVARTGEILYLWFVKAKEITSFPHRKICAEGYAEAQRMGRASGAAEETLDNLPILGRELSEIVCEKPPEHTYHLQIERRLGYLEIMAVRGVMKVVKKGIDAVD